MKKTLIIILTISAFISCNHKNSFKIEGTVNNANREMIYLDHLGLSETHTIDSVKLSKKGDFTLRGDRPDSPDFYRLRINNKTITFSVDSTETIRITANLPEFSTEYDIEGSEESENIKQLRISVINIQKKISALPKDKEVSQLTAQLEEIENDIKAHKEKAQRMIMRAPSSPTAYFALYQKLNNQYLFSPYNKEDEIYWNTVATAYQAYKPEDIRTKNIYNLILDIKQKEWKRKKEIKDKLALNELMQYAKGYIDIRLPDRNNNELALSDLEGKVVLIDFSAYETSESIDYTFALRELYNKYHNKGLEIYQVSIDRNRLLWEISTENIPWICVRDENGTYIAQYNVKKIPTSFLMDQQGNIIGRDLDINQLDKKINNLLKK